MLARCLLIYLGRENEVVLVQSLYFVGLKRNRGVAPTECDIGMMALALGEICHTLHKPKRVGKAAEFEPSLDAVRVIEQGPSGRLPAMILSVIRRKRRDSALTGRAGFRDQLFRMWGHGATLQDRSSLPCLLHFGTFRLITSRPGRSSVADCRQAEVNVSAMVMTRPSPRAAKSEPSAVSGGGDLQNLLA
jgi:hypothetical protein